MHKRLVSIYDFQLEGFFSNGTSVEKVNEFFIVLTSEEVNVSRDIREAVSILENRALAAKIIKGFSRSRITYKCAKRLFVGFRIEVLKQKPQKNLSVQDLLSFTDKSPQKTEESRWNSRPAT